MKRYNNLYHHIYDLDNLRSADKKARKNKTKQKGVIKHAAQAEANLLQLQKDLIDKTFKTSKYTYRTIHEPKERQIAILPYYPDRIVHHAIANVLKPIWLPTLTADTYSCIPGKGVHAASFALRSALKDTANTTYCLKLDINKFYPSINHDAMKVTIRRKIKDKDLLWLLDEIIESSPGLPIGNYLSQLLANLYLSPLDHWLKEHHRVKYYFRYMDDIVILSSDKAYLHAILADIRNYLYDNLRLTVKYNYQVFPVEKRGIDFVGYKHYHTHVLLRKSIKQRFIRNRRIKSRPSYEAWAKHCNSKNLLRKINNFFLANNK